MSVYLKTTWKENLKKGITASLTGMGKGWPGWGPFRGSHVTSTPYHPDLGLVFGCILGNPPGGGTFDFVFFDVIENHCLGIPKAQNIPRHMLGLIGIQKIFRY